MPYAVCSGIILVAVIIKQIICAAPIKASLLGLSIELLTLHSVKIQLIGARQRIHTRCCRLILRCSLIHVRKMLIHLLLDFLNWPRIR